MTIDLATRYLGLELKNPVVVSACPLTAEPDVLRRFEEYGAAAVVFPSLFQEQIALKEPSYLVDSSGGTSWGESQQFFRELAVYNRGPTAYLKHLEDAKRASAIPIIGSMNVTAPGEWIHVARRIEAAGADALELNIFFVVTDPNVSSTDVEARYVELVRDVRGTITIPLAVKIGPYFSALPRLAGQLVEAGADGLVLFNRYLQPNVDLATLRVTPQLSLSESYELRLPLRWIALLRGQIKASLAASSGIHSSEDVIKALLVGADVAMTASALYRHGVDFLAKVIEGLNAWLGAQGHRSVSEIRGLLSQARCPDPSAFERANYTKAISSFSISGE